MRLIGMMSLALATALMAATAVGAQSLGQVSAPAEIPPASYKGKQYVDSRGCIFIRAGFGGNVTWVPRVSRNRKVICNARPTRVAGAEPLDPPAAANNVRESAPRRTVRSSKPRPDPVPAAKRAEAVRKVPTGAAPGKRRIVAKEPATTAQPRESVVKRPVAASAPRTMLPTVRKQAACDYGNARSNRYVNSGANFPVRCGPQAVHPADVARSSGAVDNGAATSRTLAAPRPVTVPRGYQRVWEDGRLNEKRGVGTVQGAADTQLVWTNTVPRRLVETRKPVETISDPRLISIGTYRDDVQAQNAVKKLRLMGYPVRIARLRTGGVIVAAGPFFAAGSDLSGTVRQLRLSGFPSARLR